MVNLAKRIERMEDWAREVRHWQRAEQMLAEGKSDRPLVDLVAELRTDKAQSDRYRYLAIPMPNGMVDVEPVLRAIAAEEGLDPDGLVREAEMLLKEMETSSESGDVIDPQIAVESVTQRAQGPRG